MAVGGGGSVCLLEDSFVDGGDSVWQFSLSLDEPMLISRFLILWEITVDES